MEDGPWLPIWNTTMLPSVQVSLAWLIRLWYHCTTSKMTKEWTGRVLSHLSIRLVIPLIHLSFLYSLLRIFAWSLVCFRARINEKVKQKGFILFERVHSILFQPIVICVLPLVSFLSLNLWESPSRQSHQRWALNLSKRPRPRLLAQPHYGPNQREKRSKNSHPIIHFPTSEWLSTYVWILGYFTPLFSDVIFFWMRGHDWMAGSRMTTLFL